MINLPMTAPASPQNGQHKTILGNLMKVSVNAQPNQPTQYSCLMLLESGEQVVFQVAEAFFVQFQQLAFQESQITFAWLKFDWHSQVVDWRIFQAPLSFSELWPIYQSCYQFELLERLIRFGNFLTGETAKTFFWNCFRQIEFMKKFVAVPASKSHHHSVPSGLLEHSLECLQTAYKNLPAGMSLNERELTLLAALFHDAGKVFTLDESSYTNLGFSVAHDSLNLMALAAPLSEFAAQWKDGHDALVYLLSWTEKQGFCLYMGGYIIKLSDQMSTNCNLRKASFKDKPESYQFAFYQAGANQQKICRLN